MGDPTKYIKKHYEDRNANPRPPANLKAGKSSVEVLNCPRPKLPTPPPPKAAPPPPAPIVAPPPPAAPAKVVMRPPKRASPVPETETVFSTPCQDVDNDNSKWSWLRSGDKSASKARFSLSIYW